MRHSKRYEVRPYREGDLAKLDLLDDERQTLEALPKGFLSSLVDKWDAFTHCGICFLDGNPLYVGGSFPAPDRVNTLEVFMIPDKFALLFPCHLLRSLDRWIRRLEINTSFQIQTHSVDTPHIDRFMQALKFTDSGIRRTINGISYKVWRRG